MNSRQLENILKNTNCFVANTDKAGTIGEHWVACYVPNKSTIEYFDSLGEAPNKDLSAHLNQFDKILINDRQIQFPFSDACGHYCVYFLVSRCSGTSYCETMDTLYKTRAMSDQLVKSFVRHIMRV